jgi:hypothetical protein
MKEVIESGTTYIVSDNYPEPPYIKYAKTTSVPFVAADPFKVVTDKLDALALQIETIKTQTKK